MANAYTLAQLVSRARISIN
jgi:hypothetical protein